MIVRLRRLLLLRLVRGDARRWVIYFLASSAWRRYRRLSGREPEFLYRGTLGPGSVFGLATSTPLPRRLRSRRLRKALEAAARADLA